MTILIGTRRDASVVIATDRRWHGSGPSGAFTTGTTTKLVVHPGLPLALASGGFLRLPVGGEAVRVTALLDAILAEITGPDQLAMEPIFRLLVARLHPAVLAALANPSLAAVPEERQVTTVLVGMVTRGRAQLGRVLLSRDVAGDIDELGLISAPLALRERFTSGAYADEDALYAGRIACPERIAAHFRETIAGAVAEEARLNGGQNREVGGGIDVAIVRAGAARLY